MKNRITYLLILTLLGFASCRSSRKTTVQVSDKSNSVTLDSCYDRLTVHQDSVKIKLDTVSTFLPIGWLNDTTGYADPAPMTQRQGRATIKVERKPGGILVTASCDSLLFVLYSREREILRLRQQVTSTMKSKLESDKQVRVVARLPPLLIISLVISIALNVLIIYLNIKKRVL